MHAEKIRTADLPSFRLEPRDAVIVVSLIGIAAYVIGFIVGLAVRGPCADSVGPISRRGPHRKRT